MIELMNTWGSTWLRLFVVFELQNTVFILLVFVLLGLFKRFNARFKKQLSVLALIKTLIPPVLFLPSTAVNATIAGTLITVPLFASPIDASLAARSSQVSYAGALFIAWLAGMALVLLITLRNFWKLRQLAKEATEFKLNRSHLPNRTTVFMHPNIKSPLVFGCLSPKIILPTSWNQMPERMKYSLLKHEINHVRNGDLYLNLLKFLSLMIHFFNPFQWLLLHYFELFSEMTCDDRTIEESDLSRDEYNALIVKAAEAITMSASISRAWGFSRAFRLLKQRISYQLNRKEKIKMRHPKLLRITILTFLVFVMIPLSWRCSKEQKENTSPNAVVSQQAQKIVDENGVYAFFAVDKKPELLKKVRPVYPEKARKAGIDGLVVLTVTIGEDGKVIEAVPLKEVPIRDSNGRITKIMPAKRHPELEPAAIAAAMKCQFKPAEKDGHPVKVKMNIPFRFRLK